MELISKPHQCKLPLLCLLHFFMLLCHRAESLATFLSPSCLWNYRNLSSYQALWRASPIQSWASCPCRDREEQERLSWFTRCLRCLAGPAYRRGSQSSTTGNAGPRWGPAHFMSVFITRKSNTMASSPYFIPASVWSVGKTTTGNSN